MPEASMDEEHDREVALARKLHERARYLRGRFLNSVAVIEHDIAVILTRYFCTDDEIKKELFFVKVAGQLSLEKKKKVLLEILKKDYPRYWQQHKDTLSDLQQIQEFRNKLAHSIVDVSDDALHRPLERGVGFVQWKQGAPIPDEEFQRWEERASRIIEILIGIKRLLPFKEKPVGE